MIQAAKAVQSFGLNGETGMPDKESHSCHSDRSIYHSKEHLLVVTVSLLCPMTWGGLYHQEQKFCRQHGAVRVGQAK